MNRSTPGLPVHHPLPEFTQTHVHQVGDAIQPSHPLSSPSPPAPNPSQHQNLFQGVIALPTKVQLVKVFPVVMYGCECWTVKKAECRKLMLLNCGVGEDSWESLGLQGNPTSPFWRRSVLNIVGKDWCWSWNSNTLATWCEELTHLKRPLCWESLRARGEGDYRGWDGWMASPTHWMLVWVNSVSWWWTGRPGVLQFMGSQRVGHGWVTELKWYV